MLLALGGPRTTRTAPALAAPFAHELAAEQEVIPRSSDFRDLRTTAGVGPRLADGELGIAGVADVGLAAL